MNFPHEFIIRTRQLLGDNYPFLEDALQKEAPASIRINPAKVTAAIAYEKVNGCNTGYYLPQRPSFTFDPLFHAGRYYVQEASSMFLEQAVRQYITSRVICLDLCAAPGGKSTHLAGILPEESLLVSNEAIRSRSFILAENMAKWGIPNVVTTNNDPKEIGMLTHLFDLIVADMPCSGEGMFRKDPESRNKWSPDHVQLCAARQQRIVHDVWNALKPGGLFIYSTCTFNREENEENIQYFIDTFRTDVLPISVDDRWQIHPAIGTDLPLYRFFPHLVKGEGFFLAVLRKPENERQSGFPKTQKRRQMKQTSPAVPARAKAWIAGQDEYQFAASSNHSFQAIPAAYMETYRLLSERLKIISAGIPVGELKGNDLVPLPALALNTAFNQMAFPQTDLPWEEAIRFLQKEALVPPPHMPKGFVLITFQNQPLGFVKNTGNRANNLYPQQWRIRSRQLPEKRPDMLSGFSGGGAV
jgi:16S rRNA C967 or C1407 C5-methylase (RsmB/RsmF family)/NOL1/NOP2/fmu family ribosome biogenesis protein